VYKGNMMVMMVMMITMKRMKIWKQTQSNVMDQYLYQNIIYYISKDYVYAFPDFGFIATKLTVYRNVGWRGTNFEIFVSVASCACKYIYIYNTSILPHQFYMIFRKHFMWNYSVHCMLCCNSYLQCILRSSYTFLYW
jgi:hypothetical protein